MAEIPFGRPGSIGHHGRIWKWTAVTEADTCKPVSVQGAKDVTIFAEGNFGAGGNVGLESSPMIDETPAAAVYAGSNDFVGSFIALTMNSHAAVAELGVYYKPVINAGTGVSVDIYLEARY